MNGHIGKTQKCLREIDPAPPPDSLGEEISVSIGKFHRLVEMVSSVINGNTADRVIDPAAVDEPAGGSSTQDEIDAMF